MLKIARCMKMGVAVLSAIFCVKTAFASGGGETFAEGLNYLPIKPPLIINYGGVGKIKFIKVEISMRVESNLHAVEVTHHMPLIRDTLIMLFSGMTDEQVSSAEGKEQMRQQALAKINEVVGAQIKAGEAAVDGKDTEHEKAKDTHGKDEPKKNAQGKAGAAKAKPEPVSDLFFDNLVVQK